MIDLNLNPLDCVKTVDSIASLDVLKEPGCAGSILRREIPADVRTWFDTLPPDQLPGGRVILRPGAVPDAIYQLCEIAALPPGPEREWFQEDVIGLADSFADLMGAPFLRLRLDVVTNNACRKFHIDTILARLICTYRGPGTQYGVSQNWEDPRRILTVETGASFLLRGTLWPEDPTPSLRHRSPPIEGTSQTRLTLVLDPIYDPEGEV